MSDLTHRRHYDVMLYMDAIYKFSNLAKQEVKLLNTIHTVTERVIDKKSKFVDEKLKHAHEQKETQSDNSMKNTTHIKSNTDNAEKLRYVRDDLDDIDENDISEKKRLAFLETMITMKKNAGEMTDKEIWEEVNTIMFEV